MNQLGKIGFRIMTDITRPPVDLVEKFRGLASSNLADAMGRFNFMDSEMLSRSDLPLCGVAVTATCRPGDNLMVHKALEVAEPGDIVVVTTNGNVTSAVFGEMMCHTAVAAKLGGIIVDGPIRDVDAITRLKFPAYSRVVNPGGCDKDGPGEINVPISCAGAVVHPGDIVVGDGDGLAVVPQPDAAQVLELVGALVAREQKRIAEIKAGVVFKPEINQSLRKKGVLDEVLSEGACRN